MTTLRGASSWYVTSGLGLVGLDVAGAIERQALALDRRLIRSELVPLLELKGAPLLSSPSWMSCSPATDIAARALFRRPQGMPRRGGPEQIG